MKIILHLYWQRNNMHAFCGDGHYYSIMCGRSISLDMSKSRNIASDLRNFRDTKEKSPAILLFAIKHFEEIEHIKGENILKLKNTYEKI